MMVSTKTRNPETPKHDNAKDDNTKIL